MSTVIVHCRISQGPSGPLTIVSADGFVGPPVHVSTGVYRVSLDPLLGFTDKVGLQVSGTKPNVTCSVECIDATTVEVMRCAGGGFQDGDVQLWAVEAVPIMRRAWLAVRRAWRALMR